MRHTSSQSDDEILGRFLGEVKSAGEPDQVVENYCVLKVTKADYTRLFREGKRLGRTGACFFVSPVRFPLAGPVKGMKGLVPEGPANLASAGIEGH